MTGKGIFQRLAPFFATLAVGVLIASIFVDVTSPFGFRTRRMQMRNELQQLRNENDQLRLENSCLIRKLAAQRGTTIDIDEYTIPPVPPVKTDIPPPPPPRAPGARYVR